MNAAVVFALVSLAAGPPVEAPVPLDAVVHRHGEAYVAEKPHLAVVIAVTTPRGRQVWGFGGIDRDGRRIVPDGATLYEIGSITKTFTGTLLADLVREGRVAVDDPVRAHLPDGWPMPIRDDRDISLLHLATHTSSLPRMPPGFGAFNVLTGTQDDPYSAYTEENLRVTLSMLELDRPIGSRYEYSNLGAGLLGLALADVAGEATVDELFERRLLGPLGLTDTGFIPTDSQLARLAPPFGSDGTPDHSWHFDCLKACGGLRSTADDLLTYAEAALGRTETPLKPAFETATQPWRQTCEGRHSIGFGWFTQPLAASGGLDARTRGRLVWHGGATGGYHTFLGLLPEHDSAVVILSNSTAAVDPALVWPVLRAVLRENRPRRSGLPQTAASSASNNSVSPNAESDSR